MNISQDVLPPGHQYYCWRQDWNRAEDVCDVVTPPGWAKAYLLMGKALPQEFPPLHFITKRSTGLSDALLNRWNYLVFSPKLRETLAALTDTPIQYLEARVSRGVAGRSIPGYCLCNPLVSIAAIDRQRSELDYYDDGTGDIMAIKRLVLDEQQVGAHSLFRVRDLASLLIARVDVAQGIIENGCIGISFVPVAEYRR